MLHFTQKKELANKSDTFLFKYYIKKCLTKLSFFFAFLLLFFQSKIFFKSMDRGIGKHISVTFLKYLKMKNKSKDQEDSSFKWEASLR